MNTKAKLNSKVDGKNLETANRLIATARRYKDKYCGQLGKDERWDLAWGQKPTRLAIMPALALREFGVDPTKGSRPGEVFTVTCGKDTGFEGDEVALGSLFYALAHLKIREIEVHGWTDSYSGKKGFPAVRKIFEMASKYAIGLLEEPGTAKVTSHVYAKKFNEKRQCLPHTEGEGTTSTPASQVESRETEALVIECSDSRVMGRQVFEGHEVSLVSNAGNVLSPIALDAIGEAVSEGVPAIMILGHSNCGAVAAAIDKNDEAPLAQIMRAVQNNLAGKEGQGHPVSEILNAFVSAEMLRGEREPELYPGRVREVAGLIAQKGTAVVPLYLNLTNGEVSHVVIPEDL